MASWCAVVPVKRLDRAKSRLHLSDVGLPDSRRPDLALAFACDTVSAALACCEHVVVVTDDVRATQVLSQLGAHVITDDPDAGINPALKHGFAFARIQWPGTSVLAISSDLACVDPQELRQALELATALQTPCFVCDNAGTGTTALLSPAGQDCEPQFGRRSRAAHRCAGIHELLEVPLTTVRRDIDTAADLWDAQRLGLGAHSQAVLNEAR